MELKVGHASRTHGDVWPQFWSRGPTRFAPPCLATAIVSDQLADRLPYLDTISAYGFLCR